MSMNSRPIPATIIRANRKNLEIKVGEDEGVTVRAPYKTPDDYIEKVLNKKRLWIKGKQGKVRRQKALHCPKEYVEGEGFLYLGRSYKLHLIASQEESLKFYQNAFYIDKQLVKEGEAHFSEWYKIKALKKLTERCSFHAKRLGFKFSKVSVTAAEKRWGSCNPKAKTLNFSWRLIMAPIEVIDYIVIHELCHLEYPNHSPEFWAKVRSICPSYQVSEKWLEANRVRLFL